MADRPPRGASGAPGLAPPPGRSVSVTPGLMALLVGLAATLPAAAQAPEAWLIAGQDAEDYELTRDTEVAFGGEASLRLAARGNRHRDAWAVGVQMVDATRYRGRRVRLRGHLRSEDAGSGGLWLRVDGIVEGKAALLALDNMEDRRLEDTRDWTLQEIVVDVAPEAVTILMGAMISGDGAIWVDELSFAVVPEEVEVTVEAETVVTEEPYARPPGVFPAPTNLDFEKAGPSAGAASADGRAEGRD